MVVHPQVLAKSDIAEFTRTGVKFVDGSNVDADEVIFATGYDVSFPFLDSDIHPSELHVCLTNYTAM